MFTLYWATGTIAPSLRLYWAERRDSATAAEILQDVIRKTDFDVVSIWIRPAPFADWCKERNLSPDQRARFTFVNEAARERTVQR